MEFAEDTVVSVGRAQRARDRGSRGIGLGAAMALARPGRMWSWRRAGSEELQAAVAAMRDAGLSAEAAVLDVTDRAAVARAAGPGRAGGRAGELRRHGAAWAGAGDEEADYDAVMAVNVKAAFVLAQEVARRMTGPGSIIQISSQMGHVGGIDRAVYCATKHAVEGMTKAMAIEWGPRGIRVNTICPTFIRTPLTEGTFADPEKRAWIESKIKLGRVGTVEDVMGAVVYLASDASALVTGTALMVDGGWTAG
jgi:NAD(P)-dependent dehydrogenase (short-subunit alcohol dehydrogenase family)